MWSGNAYTQGHHNDGARQSIKYIISAPTVCTYSWRQQLPRFMRTTKTTLDTCPGGKRASGRRVSIAKRIAQTVASGMAQKIIAELCTLCSIQFSATLSTATVYASQTMLKSAWPQTCGCTTLVYVVSIENKSGSYAQYLIRHTGRGLYKAFENKLTKKNNLRFCVFISATRAHFNAPDITYRIIKRAANPLSL